MGGRRQFGTLRRLPSARWQVRYPDQWGQRHSATFATKRQAQQHLAEVQADLHRGTWTDPRLGRITFGEWADDWFRTTADLRDGTRARYQSLLRQHLLPTFGGRPLASITTTGVKAWRAGLLRASRDVGRPGPNTVAKAYRLLASIMRAAVDERLIVTSPCTIRGAGKDEVREMRCATPDEVAELAAAVPDQYRALVLLAAWCGLRLGEAAGLARRHIDLLHRTVTVERQLQWHNGQAAFVPPKTDASYRTVALPGVVADALEAHLNLWTAPDPGALVFTAPQGGLFHAQNFRRRVWHPAVRATGLRGLRFHDLRHTAGTLAATTPGATLRDVQARLGHASVAAALRYQHASAERDVLIADHLDSVARSADPA